MHRTVTLRFLFLAALLVPVSTPAFTVSGHVRNESGQGIFDVDMDFFDQNLNQIIFTPNDNTDPTGFYSVSVPASDYDVTFRAPVSGPYMTVEIRDVTITGNTTLNQVLPVGQLVSGTVTSTSAAPLLNVDLDFFDVALGDVIDTNTNNNDNTDAAGNFGVLVPAATYDVRFIPPLGQPYAGKEIVGVTVTAPMSLGGIQLEPGLFVSGTVFGPGAVPVSGADLDFEDAATGATIFTPRDNTDGSGVFDVAVPAGNYHVTVAPAAGSGIAWKTIYDVAVGTDVSLGTVQLLAGFNLTGTVRDAASTPLVGADLDMIQLSTGEEVPTANDNTGVGGAFTLLGPATLIDVYAYPPVGAVLAAGVVRNVNVTGNTNLGTITLPAGFSVSGTVSSSGLGVGAADIDAFELATGKLYPTASDNSGPTGAYGIRLPGGSYRLVANPPPGSGLQPDSVLVFPLNSDRVVNFDLGGTVGADVVVAQTGLALHPAAPNPMHSSTRIAFDLPAGVATARVTIFDTAGRLVRELAPGTREGRGAVSWDGRDSSGRRSAAGVYHYRLEADGRSLGRKLVVLR
ncbi:MAG: FlgD immunoglobulin-like domain containing protein [Candidatus Eiseniibacteriota bacterium]